MRILGRNIGLFDLTSGAPKPYGASTGCALEVQGDVIELASLSSNAKSFIPGKYSWMITVDALYDVDKNGEGFQTTLLRAKLNRTKLRVIIAHASLSSGDSLEPSGDHFACEGDVYVSNFRMGAEVGGYATASVQLQGTGELIIDKAQQTAL